MRLALRLHRLPFGAWLILAGVAVGLGSSAAHAARVTTAGRVVSLAANTLIVHWGARYRLEPGKTQITNRGGLVGPNQWSAAFQKNETVIVVHDGQGTALSVRPLAGATTAAARPSAPTVSAPAAIGDPTTVEAPSQATAPEAAAPALPTPKIPSDIPLRPGEYQVMGMTTYTPEGKSIPLLWLRAADRSRLLLEIDARAEASGPGISGKAVGPEAIKAALSVDTVVRIVKGSRLPTVLQFGDPGSRNVINGVLRSATVLRRP